MTPNSPLPVEPPGGFLPYLACDISNPTQWDRWWPHSNQITKVTPLSPFPFGRYVVWLRPAPTAPTADAVTIADLLLCFSEHLDVKEGVIPPSNLATHDEPVQRFLAEWRDHDSPMGRFIKAAEGRPDMEWTKCPLCGITNWVTEPPTEAPEAAPSGPVVPQDLDRLRALPDEWRHHAKHYALTPVYVNALEACATDLELALRPEGPTEAEQGED